MSSAQHQEIWKIPEFMVGLCNLSLSYYFPDAVPKAQPATMPPMSYSLHLPVTFMLFPLVEQWLCVFTRAWRWEEDKHPRALQLGTSHQQQPWAAGGKHLRGLQHTCCRYKLQFQPQGWHLCWTHTELFRAYTSTVTPTIDCFGRYPNDYILPSTEGTTCQFQTSLRDPVQKISMGKRFFYFLF